MQNCDGLVQPDIGRNKDETVGSRERLPCDPQLLFEKMLDGTPLIRVISGCSPDLSENVICVAFLTEDLSSIKFLRNRDAEEAGLSVSVLYFSDIEQVAPSNSHKNAVALLLRKHEVIIELIFALSEDAECWFTGLTALISTVSGREPAFCELEAVADNDSCGTESQDSTSMSTLTTSPVLDLVNLVNDLQSQNEKLKTTLVQYDTVVDELKEQLGVVLQANREAEAENAKLTKLLYVREDTITELSQLVQFLIQKQQSLSLRQDCPEEFFIGNERKVPRLKDLLRNNERVSSATTVSESADTPLVLRNLEGQLKILEDRKQVLESMLAGR